MAMLLLLFFITISLFLSSVIPNSLPILPFYSFFFLEKKGGGEGDDCTIINNCCQSPVNGAVVKLRLSRILSGKLENREIKIRKTEIIIVYNVQKMPA